MGMRLIDETHTYVNEEKPYMNYVSVTTMIHKYCNEFDTEFHAQRVADRRGVTKEEIIAEWQEINDQANIFGTALHEICERYLLANRIYIAKDHFEAEVITAFDDLGIVPNAASTKPEHIMSWEWYDLPEDGLAGTADVIEDVGDEYFNIWDFKTNKRFDFENKYGQFMKYPVDKLMDCHYNIYSLQLSVYALMYERETGRKLRRMGLLYWHRNEKRFELIPVGYLKRDAEFLLNHFKMEYFKDKLNK